MRNTTKQPLFGWRNHKFLKDSFQLPSSKDIPDTNSSPASLRLISFYPVWFLYSELQLQHYTNRKFSSRTSVEPSISHTLWFGWYGYSDTKLTTQPPTLCACIWGVFPNTLHLSAGSETSGPSSSNVQALQQAPFTYLVLSPQDIRSS